MRNIVITAAIMAGLGIFMAQMANKMAPRPRVHRAARQAAPAAPSAQAGAPQPQHSPRSARSFR